MYDFNSENTRVLTNGIQSDEYKKRGEYLCYEVTGKTKIRFLIILGLSDSDDESRLSFRQNAMKKASLRIFTRSTYRKHSLEHLALIQLHSLLISQVKYEAYLPETLRTELSVFRESVSAEVERFTSHLDRESIVLINNSRPRLGAMLINGTSDYHFDGIDALIKQAFALPQ